MDVGSRIARSIFLVTYIVFLSGKAVLVFLKLTTAFVLSKRIPYYLALFFLISAIFYSLSQRIFSFSDPEAPFESAGDQIVSGSAMVIDGDTLEVNGVRIHLHGIDAPELGQEPWGKIAADTLRFAISEGGGLVESHGRQKDQYSRLIAICASGDVGNLGEALVTSGVAFAYRPYSTRYVPAEEIAKKLGLGVWHYAVEKPWEWRKNKKSDLP